MSTASETVTITHVMRLDDVAVVQTLEEQDVQVGRNLTVAGLDTYTTLNGTFQLLARPQYELIGVDDEGDYIFDTNQPHPNQLLFSDAGDDIERTTDTVGTVTYSLTVAWIDNDALLDWLGIDTASANDTTMVTNAVNAANWWAYNRRKAAGHYDSVATAPNDSAKLGTTMYAGSLYRTRGVVDQYATFDQMGANPPVAGFGQIMQLLGINRPQVA